MVFDAKLHDEYINKLGTECFERLAQDLDSLNISNRNYLLRSVHPMNKITSRIHQVTRKVFLEIVGEWDQKYIEDIFSTALSPRYANHMQASDVKTMRNLIIQPVWDAISESLTETLFLVTFSNSLKKKYGKKIKIASVLKAGMKYDGVRIFDFREAIGQTFFLDSNDSDSNIHEILMLTGKGVNLELKGKILCPAGREGGLVNFKSLIKFMEKVYDKFILPMTEESYSEFHKEHLERGNNVWRLILGEFEIEIQNKKYVE